MHKENMDRENHYRGHPTILVRVPVPGPEGERFVEVINPDLVGRLPKHTLRALGNPQPTVDPIKPK